MNRDGDPDADIDFEAFDAGPDEARVGPDSQRRTATDGGDERGD
jgi:hypothetical protein